MKPTKNQFMQTLLANTKFMSVAGSGLRTLKNDNVAKVSIKENGMGGEFVCLQVQVLNKSSGLVDVHLFPFDSYLVKAADSRQDRDEFKVIEHCGWSWYIITPSAASIKQMFAEIDMYVSYFE